MEINVREQRAMTSTRKHTLNAQYSTLSLDLSGGRRSIYTTRYWIELTDGAESERAREKITLGARDAATAFERLPALKYSE
jgi:hypothetical protein